MKINNTLKTKGYNFEHNYGHGEKNLSNVLASLALVAFLYHTIMNLVDILYAQAKKANGSRINFFNTIKGCSFISGVQILGLNDGIFNRSTRS